ncbi:MAG TPA: NADH-quinone oxidoreductase subunit NuoK [Gemmatimonadales bacterium]|nr:NADH-quinone oxidoreductase subunit NuoK [Gemmatimonadales bacterium]
MTWLHWYLLVALLLFCIGLYGLVQRRSLVAMLIALELMLAAVSLNVVAITSLSGRSSSVGQVVAIILIGVAAAEGAVALSLFVAIQREVQSINVENLSELKG